MKTITIFTPTYNRAYALPILYKSLCRQTNKDFLWLIVDDGSTDNTKDIVEEWQSEGELMIDYYKQQNGGKMRAHNRGVLNCKTALFVCVDSDDFLSDDAIETIIKTWKRQNDISGICGIVGKKGMKKIDNQYVSKDFPKEGLSTQHQLYASGFQGETTLIFVTEILKNYLFPEIEGEKFITESYIYDQIDQEYKYVVLNKDLTFCEYLEDGYSKNYLKLYMNNPKGYSMYYNQKNSLFKYGFARRMKYLIYYISYAKFGKLTNIYRDSSIKGIPYFCAYLVSLFYIKKTLRRYNSLK